MSDIESRRSEPGRRHSVTGDVARAAYVFARSGVIGLVGWLLRSQIRTIAARYVTAPVAAGLFVVALALLAIGNNFHIRPLSFVGGWSLLLVPLAYLLGSLRRTSEAAWAAEHGRDTPAFEAAVEADDRRQDLRVAEDDWLIDPPWRRRSQLPAANRSPRFGRK